MQAYDPIVDAKHNNADNRWILYGDRGSGSAVVELALAELGTEVELRDISLESDEQRAASYRAVNPHGKLPALRTPTGELLTESAAILMTLAERDPSAALLPCGPAERARAIRWLLYVATEIYPLVEIVDYPDRFLPDTCRRADPVSDESAGESLRQHIRQIWKQRWLAVEAAVSGQPWLLESGFCVVDLYIAVVSRWAGVASWRVKNLRRIDAIAAAVASRERFAGVWQRHFGTASAQAQRLHSSGEKAC